MGLLFFEVGNVKRVIRKCRKDIRVELFLIHDDHCSENRIQEFRCSEGDRNMFLSEHQVEITWIDGSIVAISPFRVDVLVSS